MFEMTPAIREPRPQWYDLQRLQEIRDRHAQLAQQFAQASQTMRGAVAEVATVRRDAILSSPLAADLLGQPVANLRKLTVSQMDEVKLDPRTVQRIAVAEQRVKTLEAARNALQARVSVSIAFMERVEAYARRNHLDN